MNDDEKNAIGTNDALLDPGRAACLLAVPVSTLSRWRNEHRELPYVRVGRLVRYRRRDLEAWIESNTIRPDR